MNISADKQMIMLDYLMLKYDRLSIGKALMLLQEWSYRVGTQLDKRG
jgi:hypothetical protein